LTNIESDSEDPKRQRLESWEKEEYKVNCHTTIPPTISITLVGATAPNDSSFSPIPAATHIV
jgi:hypothetical protein